MDKSGEVPTDPLVAVCSLDDASVKKTSSPGLFASIFSYCPYVIAGKKVVRMAKGEPLRNHDPPTNREINLKSQMKLGGGFALVGVICPFFWMSLLISGPSQETWTYGIHSCLFILFGLVILGKAWYDLKSDRAVAPAQNVER
ncbi:MAG TPA: hypothetical protein PKZ65_11040 [Methanoregulaceae archaeon]|nr:hypothetical protein [Methanoregulaceae archaeon]